MKAIFSKILVVSTFLGLFASTGFAANSPSFNFNSASKVDLGNAITQVCAKPITSLGNFSCQSAAEDCGNEFDTCFFNNNCQIIQGILIQCPQSIQTIFDSCKESDDVKEKVREIQAACGGAPASPSFGDPSSIVNSVTEDNLKAHATPLCAQTGGDSCETNRCTEAYLSCAFGPNNQNGCDLPPSGSVIIQPGPGEHFCQKNPAQIEAACDAQIESFKTQANNACAPAQESVSSEPTNMTGGGCSLAIGTPTLSPFASLMVFSLVLLPLLVRRRVQQSSRSIS